MVENLVIVESPAKAKTIEKFLGDKFLVKSSFGHIRDLEKKNFGIDIEKNYSPKYIVSIDKKKIVSELKKLSKEASTVWLASDEDREGEAIAWHLYDELGLDPSKTKRIVFHEITKTAILKAIENPREIDIDLVNAQQARRILDRLVGFELSPVLWKKIKPSLSAGRVQSVAVRLIAEREQEIDDFKSSSSYKVNADFFVNAGDSNIILKSELESRFKDKDQTKKFLESCRGAVYNVANIETKPSKRSPAPPFTTSTLQQEASRKLGFSVSQTMSVAQKLYESGKITYMRTDSVNLSSLAINTAKAEIESLFGSEYVKIRSYANKIKGAQEAHEAIRPTYMNKDSVSGSGAEKKLYELIWKRTIASQMESALFEKTTATIDISTNNEKFIARGEVLLFAGFLKVYIDSDEDNDTPKGLLPPIVINQKLLLDEIIATQKFELHPPRYSEASLVKKLEDLGIGRPSTYAPTINTIQNREYVVKEDREGVEREYQTYHFKNDVVSSKIKSEISGAEKSKMFPTDIGIVVNNFLMKYFGKILDYNFTAKVEKEFDEIAEGKIIWQNMIDEFYKPFHENVVETTETSEKNNGVRFLGNDPKTGKPVSVRIGRYGSVVQIGEVGDEEKPKFASLLKGQQISNVELDDVLHLFDLPREIGVYEDKKIVTAIGRFGPYISHASKFVSLKKDVDDPFTVSLERAIELIEEKREYDKNKVIKTFDENIDLSILNGRWGPYILFKKNNYKIPKTVDPTTLSIQDCMKIIETPVKKKGMKNAKK